jgi:hypothetical protein
MLLAVTVRPEVVQLIEAIVLVRLLQVITEFSTVVFMIKSLGQYCGNNIVNIPFDGMVVDGVTVMV